jgi:hypothetical protein
MAKARPPTSSKPPSHVFGRPRLNQHHLSFTGPPSTPGAKFQPLPKPPGQKPYRLDVKDVLPATQYDAIGKARHLVFHVDGDLGGIKSPIPQERVAAGLEQDFFTNPADPSLNPAFFYALGDCVYFNGQATEYYGQFYQPYEHYLGPIFAVPGNHDGDPLPPEQTLAAFLRNFCATKPGVHTKDARDSARTAMIQPNVYWTLVTPLVNIIGLYSNVPEHGVIHPDQLDWFASELRTLPAKVPILVTLHHPPYSADDHHGGSKPMHDALDAAFAKAGRYADMVLAGHVHDYQRFTRTLASPKRQIPYIVAGAGGYHNLHTVARVNGSRMTTPVSLQLSGDTITLASYVDDRHGFLRLEVSDGYIAGSYYTVPRPQESWSQAAQLADSFRLSLTSHTMI